MISSTHSHLMKRESQALSCIYPFIANNEQAGSLPETRPVWHPGVRQDSLLDPILINSDRGQVFDFGSESVISTRDGTRLLINSSNHRIRKNGVRNNPERKREERHRGDSN